MPDVDSTPQPRPAAVRTPFSGAVVGSRPCPICGTHELQGRQTVCSAKCRVERSRRRRAGALAERDRQIREALAEALSILEANPQKETP